MKTPEGIIKQKVRAKLRAIGIYVYSPVPMGMGVPTLDDLCCIGGRFVGIEYKAPGKIPTPRQLKTIDDIRRAGGVAIWSDSVETILEELNTALGLDLS